MPQCVWSNNRLAIMEDGSYIEAPYEDWRVTCQQAPPQNAAKITRAKRANQLGLNVTVPEPIFGPVRGIPLTSMTKDEVLAFIALVRTSMRFVASETNEYGTCLFEPAVAYPLGWIRSDNTDRIRVISADWYIVEAQVRGCVGGGGLCAVHIAIEAGCDDDEVLDMLVRQEARFEQEHSAYLAAEEAAEREALRKEFGL